MTGSPKRSALLSALVHGAVIVMILLLTSVKHPLINLLPARDTPVYLPLLPRVSHGGGGGGARSQTEASKGVPPRPAPRVFVAPTVNISTSMPQLPMAPTILASDMHIPALDITQLGDPNGVNGTRSNGPGRDGGIGSGDHGGIGNYEGPYGPGSRRGEGAGGPDVVTGKGVTHAVKLSGNEPEYSEEARQAKIQGTVTLQIVVDANGHPRNITVVKSLGLGLDEKAVEAVSSWKFRPGTSNSKPVATLAVIEVYFRLL